MTRYKDIAPKYLYFLGLFMHVTILTTFAVMNTKIFYSIDPIGLVLILTFEMIWLLYFLFVFLGSIIYLKLDLEKRTVLYGNVFMSNETSFDELKDLRRKRLTQGVVQIKLTDRKYNLIAPRIDISAVEQILHANN